LVVLGVSILIELFLVTLLLLFILHLN
jgi:hypothetical protein